MSMLMLGSQPGACMQGAEVNICAQSLVPTLF